ncbi:hypothetical protein SAY87_026998 [Trapa incisa]|uniref:SMP domain-containing protein n=1 Tax=Trapa incisa TaxID=236973 RepID=A0AAN7H1Z2_9MYRT|nr:hypothetical protein SAY87_026998 [Trapa incisa]
MSQGQQRRQERQELVKYGDVFDVQGELADKPITPREASMMQTAENVLLGQVVAHYRQPVPVVAGGTPPDGGGVAGDGSSSGGNTVTDEGNRPISIGEALEATVLSAGQKRVERSDAAAIQAAEVRATGQATIVSGGVGSNHEREGHLGRPENQTRRCLNDK